MRGLGILVAATIAGVVVTQMSYVMQENFAKCRVLSALMPPNAKTAGADALEIERERLAIDGYNARGCRRFIGAPQKR